jgi:hypothetical protein
MHHPETDWDVASRSSAVSDDFICASQYCAWCIGRHYQCARWEAYLPNCFSEILDGHMAIGIFHLVSCPQRALATGNH